MVRGTRSSLERPLVRRLHPYVPGEQPRIQGLIKLNTNENPYPPSPKVMDAVRGAVDQRLRLYPNPTSQALREKLAKLHGCSPQNVIVGNGSDELLALAVRAFVEPAVGSSSYNHGQAAGVQYFSPSYSLYPVLADIHGAHKNPLPLERDFSLPSIAQLKRGRSWNSQMFTFITTPNAPSGRAYPTKQLDDLCSRHSRVVVLDEAYVDFADEHALPLALKYDHVLVARTFSKAYSLCFQRVGYMVGNAALIASMDKVRDSYNVNGLGQIAALATLDDLPYYRNNFARIRKIRKWLTKELDKLGFTTLPSQSNFILTRPPGDPAAVWLEKLRARKILVRWFDQQEIRDSLRITIGTTEEAQALVAAARAILGT